MHPWPTTSRCSMTSLPRPPACHCSATHASRLRRGFNILAHRGPSRNVVTRGSLGHHASCIVAICMGRAGQDGCRICSASGRGGSPDSPREPAIRYPRVPDLPRAAESAHRCGRTDARRMNTGRPVQSAAGGRGNSPLRPFWRAPGMAACAGLASGFWSTGSWTR